MALPKTGSRGDIVVQVEFVAESGTYVNWCGANGFSFSIANEIIKTNVGDCDDWGLPIQTNKSYGPQDVTASMAATWTAATHAATQAWAFDQEIKNVRVVFPNATTGQVSQYDGAALLSGLDLAEIGNTDGNPQTETVNLEFDGAIARTIAA